MGEVVIVVGMDSIEALESRIKGNVLLLDQNGQERQRSSESGGEEGSILVIASEAGDVVKAVRFAKENGLRHTVLLLECLPEQIYEEEVLISTCQMTEVRIDPNMWTAWIQAGCRWERVLTMAGSRRMAPLFPFEEDCGAVTYLLGEKLRMLEQEYGMVSDNVKFFEIVTGEGEQRRVSRNDDADLFFDLCRGNIGEAVITAVQIRLYPYKADDRRYLIYPVDSAKELLAAFIAYAGQPGEKMPTSLILANFPALPVIPGFLRKRSVIMVRIFDPEGKSGESPDPCNTLRQPLLDLPGAMAFLEEERICSDPRKPLSRLSRDIYVKEMSEAVCELILFSAFEKNEGAPLMFTLVREDEEEKPGRRQGFHLHLTGLLLRKEDHALHLAHTARLHYDLRHHSIWKELGEEPGKEGQRRRADWNIMNLDLERRKMFVKTDFSPEHMNHHALELCSVQEEIMKLAR